MIKFPKLHLPKLPVKTPHRLVTCQHVGGCEYVLVWDDGYSATYSAAVQLGYKEPNSVADVSLEDGGARVHFSDGTSMSAELLRVDTMQKVYRSTLVVLLFSAALLTAIYALLFLGGFTAEHTPIAYLITGVLCAMTALPMYRTRHYSVTYVGVMLTFIGAAMAPSYPHSVVFVAVGYALQMLYVLFMSRLVSAGYDS